MSNNHSIPIDVIGSLVAPAVECGIDIAAIFRQLDLPPDLLQSQRDCFPAKLCGQLIKLIGLQLDDEALGFLERPIARGFFTTACHATINCNDMRHAYYRVARVFNIATPAIKFSLSESGEEATIRFDVQYKKPEQSSVYTSMMILCILRWSSWMIGRPILLERLNLTHCAPSYAGDYRYIFACRHYFDAPENSVVFSTRFLDLPVVQNAKTLRQFLDFWPCGLMTQYRTDSSMTATVLRALQACEGAEPSSLGEVADRLAVSMGTIRRRLNAEGSSYQQIKESVRRDSAIYHLLRTQTPINSIGLMLGFSEPSAFNRAFKKWTGLTPGAYRLGAVNTI
jgi:AraC-like DNA-binding protein